MAVVGLSVADQHGRKRGHRAADRGRPVHGLRDPRQQHGQRLPPRADELRVGDGEPHAAPPTSPSGRWSPRRARRRSRCSPRCRCRRRRGRRRRSSSHRRSRSRTVHRRHSNNLRLHDLRRQRTLRRMTRGPRSGRRCRDARSLLVARAARAGGRPRRRRDRARRGREDRGAARSTSASAATRASRAGSALRIKRTIALHHPVTRALVEDWIPIASASVTDAGAVMSRAVDRRGGRREIQVGDVAEVLIDRPRSGCRPRPSSSTSIRGTAEVLGVFASNVGKSLDERIASWERYLSMRAGSPYAPGIRRELDELHALREQLQSAEAVARGARSFTSITIRPTQRARRRANPARVRARSSRARRERVSPLPAARRAHVSQRAARRASTTSTCAARFRPRSCSRPASTTSSRCRAPTAARASRSAPRASRSPSTVAEPPLLDKLAPGCRCARACSSPSTTSTSRRSTSAPAIAPIAWSTRPSTSRTGCSARSRRSASATACTRGRAATPNEVWIRANPLPQSGFHYGYADIELGGHTDEHSTSPAAAS